MSDFAHNGFAPVVGRSASATVFAGAAKAAWAWLSAPFRAFFERELVLRELSSLGDRDLADIGLSRSDVPAIVQGMYRRGGALANQRKLDPDLD